MVNDHSLKEARTYVLEFDKENKITTSFNKHEHDWDRYSYSCLLQLINELHLLDPKEACPAQKIFTYGHGQPRAQRTDAKGGKSRISH